MFPHDPSSLALPPPADRVETGSHLSSAFRIREHVSSAFLELEFGEHVFTVLKMSMSLPS
jgi:hypothetical protein